MPLKTIVLAAGQGVRLLPLTGNRPKHMLPVAGKPLLEHTIRRLRDCGLRDIYLVVNYRADAISQYFGDGQKFRVSIKYTKQRDVSGTASALAAARDSVTDDWFVALYGDILFSCVALKRALNAHCRSGKPVIGLTPVANPSQYGVVELRGNQVVRITEKPSAAEPASNLVNAGVFVLQRRFFEFLDQVRPSERGEFEITEAFSHLAGSTGLVGVKFKPGEWLEIGKPWDLLTANERALSESRKRVAGWVDRSARVVGPAVVEAGAEIRFGSYVEGPCYISSGAQVGPNSRIRPFTSLGRDVVIGTSCEIKNSILMAGTHVQHLSYVGDSIIGSNCNFGAGTNIANFRFDEQTVRVKVRDEFIDSGRKKLGVIMGDRVKTGINASIMPGVKVGSGAWVAPGAVVYRDVPSDTMVMPKFDFEHHALK